MIDLPKYYPDYPYHNFNEDYPTHPFYGHPQYDLYLDEDYEARYTQKLEVKPQTNQRTVLGTCYRVAKFAALTGAGLYLLYQYNPEAAKLMDEYGVTDFALQAKGVLLEQYGKVATAAQPYINDAKALAVQYQNEAGVQFEAFKSQASQTLNATGVYVGNFLHAKSLEVQEQLPVIQKNIFDALSAVGGYLKENLSRPSFDITAKIQELKKNNPGCTINCDYLPFSPEKTTCQVSC